MDLATTTMSLCRGQNHYGVTSSWLRSALDGIALAADAARADGGRDRRWTVTPRISRLRGFCPRSSAGTGKVAASAAPAERHDCCRQASRPQLRGHVTGGLLTILLGIFK